MYFCYQPKNKGYLFDQNCIEIDILYCIAYISECSPAAVVQWVRAIAPQAEGWEFESQSQQT